MVEFIHTSDWHLGNPFSSFTDGEKQRLSEARFSAVIGLFEYARRERIRLLLCAGDQIDNGELRDTSVLLRLFGIIARYPEIRVVMIAGNHDPYSPGSIYTRVDASSRPANLLFLTEPRAVELNDLGVRIYAAPLTKRYGRVNPIVALAAGATGSNATGGGASPTGGSDSAATEASGERSLVSIGLAHGSLAVSDTVGGESDAFPIPPALAGEAGLDYLALGDWHSYLKSGDRTYYPGTHEPLAFGDDAGALRVRIAGPGSRPRVTRIDTTVMKWSELRQRLTDESVASFLESLGGLISVPSVQIEEPESLGPLFEGADREAAGSSGGDGLRSVASGLAADGEPRLARPELANNSGVRTGSPGLPTAADRRVIVKIDLAGYLSLERFKQLEEGLSMAEGGFFRLFREWLPMVRPSEAEVRDLALGGYMKGMLESLMALGREGNATAEAAMVILYDFFHARKERDRP